MCNLLFLFDYAREKRIIKAMYPAGSLIMPFYYIFPVLSRQYSCLIEPKIKLLYPAEAIFMVQNVLQNCITCIPHFYLFLVLDPAVIFRQHCVVLCLYLAFMETAQL